MNLRVAKKISKNKGTEEVQGLKYKKHQVKKAGIVLARFKRNADKKAS